jgi:hypothetical protein
MNSVWVCFKPYFREECSALYFNCALIGICSLGKFVIFSRLPLTNLLGILFGVWDILSCIWKFSVALNQAMRQLGVTEAIQCLAVVDHRSCPGLPAYGFCAPSCRRQDGC